MAVSGAWRSAPLHERQCRIETEQNRCQPSRTEHRIHRTRVHTVRPAICRVACETRPEPTAAACRLFGNIRSEVMPGQHWDRDARPNDSLLVDDPNLHATLFAECTAKNATDHDRSRCHGQHHERDLADHVYIIPAARGKTAPARSPWRFPNPADPLAVDQITTPDKNRAPKFGELGPPI